jgi:PAS domain-containing protein
MVMDDATIERPDSIGSAPREAHVWAWGEEIFEAAPNGLLLIGRKDRILRVNGELCAIFGYERHELLGQSLQILLPERH